MMAAVAISAYPGMEACIAEWVTPLLGSTEAPDPALVHTYDRLFPAYLDARRGLEPVWERMALERQATSRADSGPAGVETADIAMAATT
jgi:erythritol kinase